MSEFLGSIHPVFVCFIVFFAKITEITIQSLKTCMMVKGERLKAAGLGFVECGIWGIAISTIISSLGDNLFLLLFYCLGYAAGLFLGSSLEGKIALGTSSVELVLNDENKDIVTAYLKKNSRGYTVFEGYGSTGRMNMILVVLPRREVKTISREIKSMCHGNVFLVVGDVNKFVGGFGNIK